MPTTSGRPQKKRKRNIPAYLQYVYDVVDDKIPSCKWVRLTCERHLEDLETGAERGLYFDGGAAEHAIEFFPTFLTHSKGEWAGDPLVLEPWQQFIIASLFGWKRNDGTRRFRTAYVEVPRKNGKSTMVAGVGIYMLDADGEPGAEVYSAATKKDQAKIIFDEAKRMVRRSKWLSRKIDILTNNMNVVATSSKFEPLSADERTMDGLNVHCGLIDELHAHKTRDVYDLLDTATGSRRQPMLFSITTAGTGRQTVCYETHTYITQILENVLDDDATFGIIYTIDKGDRWDDETVWQKANPNLGVSKKWDDMRKLCRKAKGMPSALNGFLRLHLNVWTNAETAWLNMDHLDACKGEIDMEKLSRLRCWAGVDLSSTTDLSACALVFEPDEDGRVNCLLYSWVPRENIEKRSRNDQVPYDAWGRDGWIDATEGNVIDHDYIRLKIRDEIKSHFPLLQVVGYDPWNATKWAIDLENDGVPVMEIRQGYKTMSPATKELERLIVGGVLRHNDNPVLKWCISNVTITRDPAENIKPDKAKSRERIDGAVALIIAIAAMQEETEDEGSVYEERGVLAV